MSSSGYSFDDVAKWLLEQVAKDPLYQDEVTWKIRNKFGHDFLYTNENGNPAINKKVLDKFKKLSGDDVVWSRSERYWRKREPSDRSGRVQE